MAQGHILTRSFEFETRQYRFGPLDVVDGVPRSMLTIGAPVVAAWCAVLWALFGPPNRLSVIVYLTVPVYVVIRGFEDDPKRERRKRITVWMHWIRYALRGHRPVVSGVRSADPREAVPWRARFEAHRARHYFGRGEDTGVWTSATAEAPTAPDHGAPIDLDQRVRVVGFDAMDALRGKR